MLVNVTLEIKAKNSNKSTVYKIQKIDVNGSLSEVKKILLHDIYESKPNLKDFISNFDLSRVTLLRLDGFSVITNKK